MATHLEALTYYLDNVGEFQIALTPQADAWDIFKYYFHEAGHVLASYHSFPKILRASDKLLESSPLTDADRKVLMSLFNRDDGKKIAMEGRQKKIADNILGYYSQGAWDGNIFVHSATPQEIADYLGEEQKIKSVIMKRVEGQLVPTFIYDKEARNDEVPAYFVELACHYILAMQLRLPFKLWPLPPIREGDSHDRAYGIARRLHSKGIIAKSYVDLRNRKRN